MNTEPCAQKRTRPPSAWRRARHVGPHGEPSQKDFRRQDETTGIPGFVTHAHTCAVARAELESPRARVHYTARIRPGYGPDTARIRPGYGPDTARIRPGYGPDVNCPRAHGCARVRASTTGTVPQALTATVVRAPEHRVLTSRTKSPAPCTSRSGDRIFPFACAEYHPALAGQRVALGFREDFAT